MTVTIDEACAAIGVGKTKLYEFLDSGELPAKKCGKRTFILAKDLEKFLNNLADYRSEAEE